MKPRDNELTTVVGREYLEKSPPGIDEGEWRAFRDTYNKAQQLVDPGYPVQLDVELNGGCNLKCSFCIHAHGVHPNTLLPYDVYQRLIDEAISMGTRSLKLNYLNEPLLSPRLIDAIRYAKAQGMLNVYFATNGILLTEEISQELIESGLTKLLVSIDAVTPETYAAMRNSSEFEKVVDNTLRFLRLRGNYQTPFVRVNFVRTELNAHEAEQFEQYWKGKVEMVGFQQKIKPPWDHTDRKQRVDFRCSFPFKQLVVDSKQNILPCCTFYGQLMPLGNFNTMTLREAWNSEQMTELRRIHTAGEYWRNEHCVNCVMEKDDSQ